MVSVPVRLHKAARRERIKFRQVYRPQEREVDVDDEPIPHWPQETGTQPQPADPEPVEIVLPVRNAPVGHTPDPMPRESILKGFEDGKDQYVVFAPREIAALRARTSTEMEILEFVRLEEIDPIYFDTSYYVAPDKGGEKPYAVLYGALARTGYAAMGSLAMHGREQATVVRAGARGLILHTLFYANEVRGEQEWLVDQGKVTPKELELATLLVQAMEAKFEPEKLKDAFEERLRALI
jgi:Ku protein